MKKLTGLVASGLIALSSIGCSVEYTPERFKYAEVDAPENLWEAYQSEDIPHNTMMWEAYQTLVNDVNKFKFDENVPKGKMIKIPDMDKNGYVWSNGRRHDAKIDL